MRIQKSSFVLVMATSSLALAAPLTAQAPRECVLDYESPTGNTRTNAVELPSHHYDVFQGGGVIYHCRGQDNTIIADSSEYYGDRSVLFLIGNVHYRETRANVDSDRMTYYQLEDRLHAEGNVNAVLQSGTTLKGPSVDYYRATPTRPLTSAIATGHPTMRIIEPNSSGRAGEPINVVANQIMSRGDSLVFASGSVEITRPDVIAKGDSAYLDNRREFARLLRSPSVQSRRDRPFTLRGGVIDLFSKKRVLQRVVATPDGHALSDDLELVADSVDLRMSSDRLDRVMAWGPKRARAISPDREITADSIDALMPGQRLREVHAVRNAYVNSVPDTAHVISSDRDWIRGDTVVAEFDSVAVTDTTSKPTPRRVIATGHASSYYQLAGDAKTKSIPNINYVKGKEITIQFVDREVSTVDVVEQASGVYIEPAPEGTITSPGLPGAGLRPAGAPPPPPSSPVPTKQIRKNEQ
jgi:lipopolysaccharide export system protein LptA